MLERVDVVDFLEALGINVESRSGENLLFLCPFHHERHPSARMNINTTAWLCSVGCGKGNAIHFLAQLKEMSYEDARDHIYGRYGIGPGAAIDDLEIEVRRNLGMDRRITTPRVAPDESWVQYLELTDWEVDLGGSHIHPAAAYWYSRGFNRYQAEAWRIGYDSLSHRIAIPVRDHNGVLVGFKGRAIASEQQPRYLILGDSRPDHRRYNFDTYSKSDYVFAMNEDHNRWVDEIVIVEGELNAIAMWERHGTPAVAVAGADFSDRQRQLIASRYRKAIIYFDDDGWRCTKGGEHRDRPYKSDEAGPCQVCGAPTFNPGKKGAAKVASMLLPFIDVDVVLNAPDDAAALPYVWDLLRDAVPAMELGVRGELDLVFTT